MIIPAVSIVFVDEVPSGTINGSNATFTLAHRPLSNASVLLFLNGVRQRQGAGNDYTISTTTITMLSGSIPQTGDSLTVTYVF